MKTVKYAQGKVNDDSPHFHEDSSNGKTITRLFYNHITSIYILCKLLVAFRHLLASITSKKTPIDNFTSSFCKQGK